MAGKTSAITDKGFYMKRILMPVTVLILFAGYTFYVMANADQSLLAFGAELMSRLDTAQVVVDLYIMAGLAIVWMFHDCRKRGKSIRYFIPFVAITLVFVSMGPLLYLMFRTNEVDKE